MKPRHTAEQSTVAVNKGQQIGKSGFAALGLKKESGAFSLPLQKSLDTIEPVSVVVPTPAPVSVIAKESEAVVTAEKILQNASVQTGYVSPEMLVKSAGFASVAPAPVLQSVAEKSSVGAPEVLSMPLEERAFVAKAAPVVQSQDAVKVCPIDPAERAQCDSCQ
jgi:ribonucleoside-diphosphate reductase alpha chain